MNVIQDHVEFKSEIDSRGYNSKTLVVAKRVFNSFDDCTEKKNSVNNKDKT